MKRLCLALVAVLAAATQGCTTYDPYYYDYAYVDGYYYAYDAAYVYGWVDPLAVGVYYLQSSVQSALSDPNSTASTIAAAADSYYTPAGCSHAQATDNVVTYNFQDCRNPFAQRLNGTVTLTVSDEGGSRTFLAKSTNLTVDNKPYVLDLKLVPRDSGNRRTVTFTSNSYSPSQVDSRTAQGTIAWDKGSECVEVNGSSQSTHGDLNVSSTIQGYQRCAGRCPASGTITVTAPDGTFTLKYDGSTSVKVTAPNGDTRSYDLVCS